MSENFLQPPDDNQVMVVDPEGDMPGLAGYIRSKFEDSENGLHAARGSGLPTLVAVSHYSRGQDFTGAVLVLDQLGEPDSPFKVLSGEADDHQYVNVELLRLLHARAT